ASQAAGPSTAGASRAGSARWHRSARARTAPFTPFPSAVACTGSRAETFRHDCGVGRRVFLTVALTCLVAAGCGGAERPSAPAAKLGGDWTRFGYDAARHNAGPTRTGITAANV